MVHYQRIAGFCVFLEPLRDSDPVSAVGCREHADRIEINPTLRRDVICRLTKTSPQLHDVKVKGKGTV